MPGTRGRSGGHNRKPIATLKLEGGYKEHRHAGRDVDPGGSVKKPRSFNKRSLEGQLWDAIVPGMQAAGILCGLDQTQLENCCRWYGIYRRELESGSFAKAEKAFRLFDSLAGRFGMSPADRSRLKIDGPQPLDETEQFLRSVLA